MLLISTRLQKLEIILSDFTDRLTLAEPWNRVLAVIWVCWMMSGCAPVPARIITIPANVMAPPSEPILPKISSEALECLSDEAYEDLVIRDTLRKQYSERLYQIIELARKPVPITD